MRTLFSKIALTVLILLFAINNYAAKNPPAQKKPVLSNRKENPSYDPNKGLLGKPKEERIIKRNRDEPILKNRKYEPRRMQKK